MDEKKLPTLSAAGAALEEQLREFEALAASAQRISLNSQRNLEKAATTTTEAVHCQERLGVLIQTFMAVLNSARDQNQQTMNALQQRAEEIKRRSDEFTALKERLSLLGQAAAEISALVRSSGAEPRHAHEAVRGFTEIETRMTELVDQAATLTVDCKDADFAQLSAEVDSLKQQTQAARNKVKLLREKLATEIS